LNETKFTSLHGDIHVHILYSPNSHLSCQHTVLPAKGVHFAFLVQLVYLTCLK